MRESRLSLHRKVKRLGRTAVASTLDELELRDDQLHWPRVDERKRPQAALTDADVTETDRSKVGGITLRVTENSASSAVERRLKCYCVTEV